MAFAIQRYNMPRFCLMIWILVLSFAGLHPASAVELKLLNGEILKGDPTGFADDGFLVRLDVGGFSPRIPWGRVTQDSLKELAKHAQAKKFAEPFIEIPKEVKQQQRAKKKEITIKEVTRVERPTGKHHFFGSLGVPPAIAILCLLFAANLYAAYEIAVFRGRPVALVCGVSAILPVAGPLLFLAIPDAPAEMSEGIAPPAPPEALSSPLEGKKGAQSGLGLAAHDKPKGETTHQGVFKRGDTTFNRRFFETQFAGFFRVVPSEAEKDLVLVIKAVKNEYVAKRISRISSNEMHMQLLRGGAEVMVGFGEITEVQVRHKDAKA